MDDALEEILNAAETQSERKEGGKSVTVQDKPVHTNPGPLSCSFLRLSIA